VRVRAQVPDHHLLGRRGLGLIVLTWGLTKERLAIVAQVVGACRLAMTLATTHVTHRHQFGQRLLDHQVIRLRLAQLHAELQTIRAHLELLSGRTSLPVREVAGLKVTAARFGERCVSECMHLFGGDGYIEDASPMGSLWRDVRLARLGGGTDEMMWELVAGGLVPDDDLYARMVP
jgi:alkylation response protein AidB-like acyl-CoA dehydrogenase